MKKNNTVINTTAKIVIPKKSNSTTESRRKESPHLDSAASGCFPGWMDRHLRPFDLAECAAAGVVPHVYQHRYAGSGPAFHA